MQNSNLNSWLESLAAKQPTPGGGAVAALAAALSAGLAGMVSAYTTGPKWIELKEVIEPIEAQAKDLREEALSLMNADAKAFQAVGTAYALPKHTENEQIARHEAIQKALIGAAKPPQDVIVLTAKLLPMLRTLSEKGNPNVISDVAVAASLAKAAIEAAIVNVAINKKLIHDELTKRKLTALTVEAKHLIEQASDIVNEVSKGLEGV